MPRHYPAMYKTKWCDFFWRSHGCKHGEHCQHAHYIQEYKGPLDYWVQYYIDRGMARRLGDDDGPEVLVFTVDASRGPVVDADVPADADGDPVVDADVSVGADDEHPADSADPPRGLSLTAPPTADHSYDAEAEAGVDLFRLLIDLEDGQNGLRERWADSQPQDGSTTPCWAGVGSVAPPLHADPPQDAFVGVGTVAPPVQADPPEDGFRQWWTSVAPPVHGDTSVLEQWLTPADSMSSPEWLRPMGEVNPEVECEVKEEEKKEEEPQKEEPEKEIKDEPQKEMQEEEEERADADEVIPADGLLSSELDSQNVSVIHRVVEDEVERAGEEIVWVVEADAAVVAPVNPLILALEDKEPDDDVFDLID